MSLPAQQPLTKIIWKLSFLEQQIQELKKLINNKVQKKIVSLKGIIKNSPGFEMEDFEQTKKSLFHS